jgi:hypothetical protein
VTAYDDTDDCDDNDGADNNNNNNEFWELEHLNLRWKSYYRDCSPSLLYFTLLYFTLVRTSRQTPEEYLKTGNRLFIQLISDSYFLQYRKTNQTNGLDISSNTRKLSTNISTIK